MHLQSTTEQQTGQIRDEQECPQCHCTIPVYRGYVAWCDRCEWNVQYHEPELPRNIFETQYAALGKKLGQQMFDELVRSGQLTPKRTISKALAYSISTFVHVLTIATAITGLMVLVTWW